MQGLSVSFSVITQVQSVLGPGAVGPGGPGVPGPPPGTVGPPPPSPPGGGVLVLFQARIVMEGQLPPDLHSPPGSGRGLGKTTSYLLVSGGHESWC